MPRLFDSACHDQIFIAASASRDRCAPYGFAYGEVSLASLGAFPLALEGPRRRLVRRNLRLGRNGSWLPRLGLRRARARQLLNAQRDTLIVKPQNCD